MTDKGFLLTVSDIFPVMAPGFVLTTRTDVKADKFKFFGSPCVTQISAVFTNATAQLVDNVLVDGESGIMIYGLGMLITTRDIENSISPMGNGFTYTMPSVHLHVV